MTMHMNMYLKKIKLKVKTSFLLGALILASSMGHAASFDPIDCLVCDEIKLELAIPKPILNSVTPDPLPRVEVGETQDVSVSWSLPTPSKPMLQQRFSLCVTGSDPIVRLKDGCIALQSPTTVMSGKEGTHYNSTVTLPGTFQRFSAYFYIRMQPVIITGGSGFTPSNLVPFNWPLHIAELEARSVKVDVGIGGSIYAEQRVTNRGTRDSAAFQNRYHMTVCSQIIDPARSCRYGDAEYLDTIVVFAQTNGVAAGATENMAVDITSLLPSSPATLTVSIRGDVDYFNDIRESNEHDNGDTGTDTLFR